MPGRPRTAARSSPTTTVRVAARVGIHAAVAVVLTWPLALHLGDRLPLGQEPVATVPLFNLWTLRWNAVQVGDLWRHYWDAPIFHPTPGAFALSEPQPLTGLLFAPVTWLTHNPVLGYDLVLLAFLTLNGVAAARLARRLGAGASASVLAGVLAQALPFTANELGVLQLTALFPVLFFADAVLEWSRRGGWRPAVAMGLWLAAVFLTCGYYGLFTVVVVGLAALTLVRRSWWAWERLAQLAAAAGVFAVLAVPVVLAQARYTSDYRRSDTTIDENSAFAGDWLRLGPAPVGARLQPWLSSPAEGDAPLYPGSILVALVAGGAVVALGSPTGDAGAVPVATSDRDPRPDRPTEEGGDEAGPPDVAEPDDRSRGDDRGGAVDRRGVVFLLTAVALAVLLSLGLHLRFGSVVPYELLRAHVPGYADLRSPFRFAALAEALAVPVAACALSALWRWRGTVGRVAAVAVVAVAVLEVWPFGQALTAVPDDASADWVAYLRDQPGAGDAWEGPAVAHVPFPETNSVRSYERTTEEMLAGLEHGRPLVNGYSGLFPASYEALEGAMRRGFPTPGTIAALRQQGVRWVVIDRSWLLDSDLEELAGYPDDLQRVFDGRDVIVYRLTP